MSWPDDGDDPTAWSYQAAFADAIALLKAVGLLGGLVVVHPWRHVTVPDGRVVWYPGMHAHALAYGALEAGALVVGPAVVVVLRKRQRSLIGTLSYILDHCGYLERRHALRWFGAASYNKAKGLSGSGPIRAKRCPVCGTLMEPLGGIIDWTSRYHPVRLGRRE